MRLTFALLLLASAPLLLLAQSVDDFDGTFTKDQLKIGKDGTTVLSGPDGIFDDYDGVDGAIYDTSNKKGDTRTKVCSDLLKKSGTPSGTFCLNYGTADAYYVTCNGKGDTTDNQYAACGLSSYGAAQFCFPTPPTDPQGKGKCMAKTKGSDVAGNFMKRPCDYFKDVMDAKGEKCSYFCVGDNGDHLLQCPENKLKRCAGGCKTMMEAAKDAGTKTQCGKAACKAAGYT